MVYDFLDFTINRLNLKKFKHYARIKNEKQATKEIFVYFGEKENFPSRDAIINQSHFVIFLEIIRIYR